MDEYPSIVEQARRAGFECNYYDFRKANSPGLDYFNPAIVRRDDGLWLVTRRSEVRDGLTYGFNSLMAFKLDENHLPQYGKQITIERAATGEHFEDPRAMFHAGSWWLSVCNFVIYQQSKTWTGAHQIFLEIDRDWQSVRRHDPIYGRNASTLFEQKGDEKNWLWFEHDGRLFMIYKTHPHTVVGWDDRIVATEELITDTWHPGWKHGEPRGGTAPIRLGDEYVSFFHSSMPWLAGKRQYFMGAYTFAARPPFEVTAVTPEPLLAGSIDDPWSPGKPLVVFPCAALYDSDLRYKGKSLNGRWTVSFGVNDIASAYAIIPDWLLRAKLSKEVRPIAVEKAGPGPEFVYA